MLFSLSQITPPYCIPALPGWLSDCRAPWWSTGGEAGRTRPPWSGGARRAPPPPPTSSHHTHSRVLSLSGKSILMLITGSICMQALWWASSQHYDELLASILTFAALLQQHRNCRLHRHMCSVKFTRLPCCDLTSRCAVVYCAGQSLLKVHTAGTNWFSCRLYIPPFFMPAGDLPACRSSSYLSVCLQDSEPSLYMCGPHMWYRGEEGRRGGGEGGSSPLFATFWKSESKS